MLRRPVSLSLALAACSGALALDAHADDAARSVVIVAEGSEAEAAATALASRMAPPFHVADPRSFRSALAARGQRALLLSLGSHAKDQKLVAHAHAALGDAHADVAIMLVTRKTRRGPEAHLWVIDAHKDGAALDEDLPLGHGAHGIDQADAAWAASQSLFPASPPEPPPPKEAAAPLPVSTPAPAVETAAVASPAADRGAVPALDTGPRQLNTRATALAILEAGLEAGSRHFSYVDRITPSLRPYDLFAAPLVSIALEVYPASRTSIPFARGLGVAASYMRAFGLASADEGGARVGTTWQAFDIGARERVNVGRTVLLGFGVGYGLNEFSFDTPTFNAALPGASYHFLRAGIDARANFGSASLFGGASYLDVLSTGPLGQLFPRESVGGIDARVGAAYPIASALELSLTLSYTRFYYSMKPLPGDANVAGGALDEMARLSIGFAYLL